MTRPNTTQNLLIEALAIAADIRHNSDAITAAQDDIRAYTEAGMTRMVTMAQDTQRQAEQARDKAIATAQASTNPQMPKALRVYAVTI